MVFDSYKLIWKNYLSNIKIVEYYKIENNYFTLIDKQMIQDLQSLSQQNRFQMVSPRAQYQKSSLETQNQHEQDLMLLIRAHQKIRELEQTNMHLRNQNQNLSIRLNSEKETSTLLKDQNQKLKINNIQLGCQILLLQNQPKNKKYQKNQSNNQLQNQTQDSGQNVETKRQVNAQNQAQNIQLHERNSRNSEHKCHKTLKPSQSTPVILNIHFNSNTKQERMQFLASCKQEFTNQLQKINLNQYDLNPKQNKRQILRNKSGYFNLDCEPVAKIHNKYENNAFLKTAEELFQFQNQRTIKHIVSGEDRKKSTSTGSLIKKNNFGRSNFKKQTSTIETSTIVFSDKTNLFNSKKASVNQILANSAKSYYGLKNQSYNLKLNTCSDNTRLLCQKQGFKQRNTQMKDNVLKKSHKSIYFNEFSRSLCNSQVKQGNLGERSNHTNTRNKKSIQINLQDQNNYGIIKYRGLCL